MGSGGREHALAWKLATSRRLSELHAAPGNPGIAEIGTCHPVATDDAEAIRDTAWSIGADLVVVGPETPLVAGLADHLRQSGLSVFGPSAAAARIEGSKAFAKEVMALAGVPTARLLDQPTAPCVVKADGLAAGKGVFVCQTESEVAEGLAGARALGAEIVVEEFLEGPEVSLFAICDGRRSVLLPAARDFKRAYDGDTGPNTGGMGSYAPVPSLRPDDLAELAAISVDPVLDAMSELGSPFVGTLFVGLMLTADGPRVIEYNCRFGDPETQSLMPLIDGDLLDALAASAAGDLAGVTLGLSPGAAVTVVLAAEGYPAAGDRGSPISGIEAARATGALVFHSGTTLRDGRVVTNGGRVLNVTGTGESLELAREAAYRAADCVTWSGMRRRNDIAETTAAGMEVATR